MADFLDMDQDIGELNPFTKGFKATAYFENYLYKIIESLGGEGVSVVGGDTIVDNSILASKIKALNLRLSEFDTLTDNARLSSSLKDTDIRTANFISKIKITNFTAVNKDWVEARKNITVKLPENAQRDDEIMISNGDGSKITVDGNGNNIKFTKTDPCFITRNKGSSYHFQYFEDNTLNERYWRVR